MSIILNFFYLIYLIYNKNFFQTSKNIRLKYNKRLTITNNNIQIKKFKEKIEKISRIPPINQIIIYNKKILNENNFKI